MRLITLAPLHPYRSFAKALAFSCVMSSGVVAFTPSDPSANHPGLFVYALFVSGIVAGAVWLAVLPILWVLVRYHAAGPLSALIVAVVLYCVLLYPDLMGRDAPIAALYIFTTAAAYAGLCYRSQAARPASRGHPEAPWPNS